MSPKTVNGGEVSPLAPASSPEAAGSFATPLSGTGPRNAPAMVVLGSIAKIKGGKRLPLGASLQSEQNDHPYIRVRDMGQRFLPRVGMEYVPEDVFPSIKRYIVNTNDLLISIVGSVGLVSLVDEYYDTASQTENCAKVSGLPYDDALYLYYWLASTSGQDEMKKRTVGAVQAKLPLYGIESIPVPWVEPIQRKAIAQILGTLDDKIELNRRINQTLEEMAQALFKSWFVDFDPVKATASVLEAGGTPQEAEQAAMQSISGKSAVELKSFKTAQPDAYAELAHIASLFPSRLTESELGPIPEGWNLCPLGTILNWSKRTLNPADFPDEIFEHFSLPAYDSGKNPTIELGGGIKSNKFEVAPEAVLISKLNPGAERVWWPNSRSGFRQISSTEFLVAVPKGVSREFLYLLMKAQPVRESMAGTATGTSNSHQRVRPSDIESISIVSPCRLLHEAFHRSVSSTIRQVLSNQDEVVHLTRCRDSLLPKLLSGELEIPGELLSEVAA